MERRIVPVILRGGLVLAAGLMAAGFVAALVGGTHQAPAIRVGDLFGNLSLSNRLIGFGVVVLAATPAARVLALLVLWAREGDRRFMVVAFVVVVVLTAGVVLGHA